MVAAVRARLNPVEALWSQAKYSATANLVPDDWGHFHNVVIEEVEDRHFDRPMLKSYFHAAQLKL